MSSAFANLEILSSFNTHNMAVKISIFAEHASGSGFFSALDNKVRFPSPPLRCTDNGMS